MPSRKPFFLLGLLLPTTCEHAHLDQPSFFGCRPQEMPARRICATELSVQCPGKNCVLAPDPLHSVRPDNCCMHNTCDPGVMLSFFNKSEKRPAMFCQRRRPHGLVNNAMPDTQRMPDAKTANFTIRRPHGMSVHGCQVRAFILFHKFSTVWQFLETLYPFP